MSAAEARRLAWAYLSTVAQGASRMLNAAIEADGPEAVAAAVRDGSIGGALRRRTAARAHLDSAAQDLELVARLGGRLVTPDDAEWPAWQLLAFDGLDGADTDAAPVALWVVGRRRIDELVERSVAVVGTRAASGYGENVTAEIAGDLAVDGWAVLSGAAFGV
ncbi:DNA processing protein DprA, partial [Rhodococcus sp. 14C212]|uniref:DNA-processing protein DprA n=1 Tax=Rhodococcus sp. 14C212 TaxID=2711209 RepID=UPI003211EB7E|nr:DNA processing protein DprA [Rhodococcus sp. 14C212]